MHADSRFHPSADQSALVSTLTQSLDLLLPVSRLHQHAEEPADTFARLDELGVFTITVAESRGGSGLGVVEESLVAMELGRRLAAPSVFATLGSAHVMAPHPGGTQRVCGAYANDSRIVNVSATNARFMLVRHADRAAIHALQGCRYQPLDQRLWLATLDEVRDLSEPVARLDAAEVLRLRLIDAAALAGMAAATVEMAVAYATVRQQFGRPIGGFQAIKHHCADMAIAARCARDQVGFASVALQDGRPDARLQIECAFVVAAGAALENAGKNIQIHGGIGFSDEADPHLFLKRARVQVALGGGMEAAYARVADRSLSPTLDDGPVKE